MSPFGARYHGAAARNAAFLLFFAATSALSQSSDVTTCVADFQWVRPFRPRRASALGLIFSSLPLVIK
jgi:hypothetical protein